MRTRLQIERDGWLLRCWGRDGEIAYLVLGWRGPRLDIEFPSDWHEHRRAWVRIGIGILTLAFSFPWPWVVPDQHQCSGPAYGFYCFDDALVLEYGKDTERFMRKKFIYAPWSWWHVRHDYLNPDGSVAKRAGDGNYEPPVGTTEVYAYTYYLKDGAVQRRMATINGEEREWRWRWFKALPWPRLVKRSINVNFSDEVGERTGSWKGGTTGCGWDWREGESMLQALRRMEREREF